MGDFSPNEKSIQSVAAGNGVRRFFLFVFLRTGTEERCSYFLSQHPPPLLVAADLASYYLKRITFVRMLTKSIFDPVCPVKFLLLQSGANLMPPPPPPVPATVAPSPRRPRARCSNVYTYTRTTFLILFKCRNAEM